MNAYLMSYFGNKGAHITMEVLTVAGSPQEALGLTLMTYPGTQANDWSTGTVDLSRPSVNLMWQKP